MRRLAGKVRRKAPPVSIHYRGCELVVVRYRVFFWISRYKFRIEPPLFLSKLGLETFHCPIWFLTYDEALSAAQTICDILRTKGHNHVPSEYRPRNRGYWPRSLE